jgi:hypothetical protein
MTVKLQARRFVWTLSVPVHGVSRSRHCQPGHIADRTRYSHDPSVSFLGEPNLLTGQTALLTARVIEAGRIHRISGFSEVLLRTFLARRDQFRDRPDVGGIEIVGSGLSAEALALRTYAGRQRLAHLWLDADSLAGQALTRLTPLAAAVGGCPSLGSQQLSWA